MKIREIKDQAFISLKGNLFKAILITLFYTLITLLIQFLLSKLETILLNAKTIFSIIMIITNISLLPLSYGLIVSLIEISKNKNISLTNFINESLLNYIKVIKIFLGIFLRILIYVAVLTLILSLIITNFGNNIINSIFGILLIINIIFLIIKSLDFVFVLFVNYDNSKLSVKEIINKSKELIKKNKLKYILLILSFILWFILFILFVNILSYFINPTYSIYILNILFALITPWITISQYVFYDSLENTKEVK